MLRMGIGSKGAFVISLDFELFWGMHHVTDLGSYASNIRGVREVIPHMLDLFSEFGIHATHATVGFVFFANKKELIAATPELKPTYADKRMNGYAHLAHIGANEATDPYHYGASLIDHIRQVPGQEIACHTLSHYFCLEPGQTLEQFEADIEAAVRSARERGVAMRSLVFPANQYSPAHLEVIKRHGFTAYRGTQQSWVHRPVARSAFLVPAKRLVRLLDTWIPLTGPNNHAWPAMQSGIPLDVPASHFLRPWNRNIRGLDRWRLQRITKAMGHAARTGTIYHLWWHPHNFGLHLEENLAFLRKILEHFDHLRSIYGMRSMNMGEVAELVLHHGG